MDAAQSVTGAGWPFPNVDRGGIVYEGDSATLRDDQARLNRLIGVSA